MGDAAEREILTRQDSPSCHRIQVDEAVGRGSYSMPAHVFLRSDCGRPLECPLALCHGAPAGFFEQAEWGSGVGAVVASRGAVPGKVRGGEEAEGICAGGSI